MWEYAGMYYCMDVRLTLIYPMGHLWPIDVLGAHFSFTWIHPATEPQDTVPSHAPSDAFTGGASPTVPSFFSMRRSTPRNLR